MGKLNSRTGRYRRSRSFAWGTYRVPSQVERSDSEEYDSGQRRNVDPRTYTGYLPGQDFASRFSCSWENLGCEADFEQKMLATNFSYGIEKDEKKLRANDRDHTKWTNPLESTLPNAPSMKFFCVYGHGKDTEVGHLLWKAECGAYNITLP